MYRHMRLQSSLQIALRSNATALRTFPCLIAVVVVLACGGMQHAACNPQGVGMQHARNTISATQHPTDDAQHARFDRRQACAGQAVVRMPGGADRPTSEAGGTRAARVCPSGCTDATATSAAEQRRAARRGRGRGECRSYVLATAAPRKLPERKPPAMRRRLTRGTQP